MRLTQTHTHHQRVSPGTPVKSDDLWFGPRSAEAGVGGGVEAGVDR